METGPNKYVLKPIIYVLTKLVYFDIGKVHISVVHKI